ncbi:hypothetical protein M422DRAFT_23601 [Sphaerobolus stellatus SS14]|nr:hypothetical protein M422DRAFT_23601 [Sphaerobolus stellatus SS14]
MVECRYLDESLADNAQALQDPSWPSELYSAQAVEVEVSRKISWHFHRQMSVQRILEDIRVYNLLGGLGSFT